MEASKTHQHVKVVQKVDADNGHFEGQVQVVVDGSFVVQLVRRVNVPQMNRISIFSNEKEGLSLSEQAWGDQQSSYLRMT